MAVITIQAVHSADGSVVMSHPSSGIKWSGSGIILDAYMVASVGGDTSIVPLIADATQTVFTMSSSDFTAASGSANQYQKNEANSNFKSLSVQGQLTSTITGMSSGTFTQYAKVLEA